MNLPEISIIVPCYNQAEYLDECLQSVLNQTFQNWECIIVNDGSPDNTEEKAEKWAQKDARFKYLNKENGGLSSARNAGIEIAKGEWILPLDSDDKIGNKYLELASHEFNHNYTLIYCKAEFFGEMEGPWELRKYSYADLLLKNHIFCSAFYKKEDWIKANGYDSAFIYGMEDWDFWLSILNPNSQVLQLNYNGFYYRRKEESMDILLYESQRKILFSSTLVYTKHLTKYLPLNKNPISNFNLQLQNVKNIDRIKNEVNKNYLTKLLYKFIEKLNS
ncbi:glycosyltransferase family 2 protein [Frigoriflavimonas asaccharolytica]|uniref:Glycosyltransferase involved in cell wall biosynthesis n=1 Tax=Frigoriflavimonas asaccharolytica TaxID=2735899 RepID=A0A8J8K857_9FLAO|nr:glycosyltransferase family A protein [Frigoriflavimonas asaccharolytica]NRS92673.1 glycosyltransferase involved in cell wall biosynthesis [Frigoriflavimonas asaccharolytica]